MKSNVRNVYCGWAQYMEARPGSFHLEHLSDLRNDYQTMKVMFFDDVTKFDSILEHLTNFESELNDKRNSWITGFRISEHEKIEEHR